MENHKKEKIKNAVEIFAEALAQVIVAQIDHNYRNPKLKNKKLITINKHGNGNSQK